MIEWSIISVLSVVILGLVYEVYLLRRYLRRSQSFALESMRLAIDAALARRNVRVTPPPT